MYNSTTDVYKTKREIVNFSKSLVPKENVVETKFVTDSIYGILKSGSIILKDMATALNEHIQIKNTIDRLSQNLQRQLSPHIQKNYIQRITKILGNNPVILVDDTDVIKPHGEKFEALGKVRDGSSKGNKIEKGYLVTEMVGLTSNEKQPVSLFTHIYSSRERGSYISHLHIQITASKNPINLVCQYC